jgi:hypothetical protein
MLFLQPREVLLSGAVLSDVSMVVVDRIGMRVAKDWDDTGPFVRFVDVVDRQVTVRVVQQINRGGLVAPDLGSNVVLTFATSPTGSDVGRKRFAVNGVVTGVTHEIGRPTGGSKFGGAGVALAVGATRTITIVATSSDGATDPVTMLDAGGLQ